VHAVAGDAADPAVLIQAHIARADRLIITSPDPIAARTMVETARMLNPHVDILIRVRDAEEAELFRRENAVQVFLDAEVLAERLVQAAGQ